MDNDKEVSLLAQMTHRCRSLPVVGVKDPEEIGSHFQDSKRGGDAKLYWEDQNQRNQVEIRADPESSRSSLTTKTYNSR